MNPLDYILLGTMILFLLWGAKKGFLQAVGSIVGIVIATVVAGQFYEWLAEFFGQSNLSLFIAFIVLFSVVLKIVGLVFWGLGKVFQLISLVPFLRTFDRVLGSVLGLVSGILSLAVVVYFTNKFPFNDWVALQLKDSVVAPVLLMVSYIFLPLMPEALKRMKAVI
ncbi:TPA: hypothetical protein DF272_06470 [Candidatus Falkowbacteria bacterium]|nr:hypothetical protein [Candidatus Falkowbacteria bacterium]